MPVDTFYGSIYKPIISVSDYVLKLQQQRDTVINWVTQRKEKIAEKVINKDAIINKKRFGSLNLGDHVRKANPKRTGEYGQKYNPIYYKEIYYVDADLNNGSYMIRDLKKQKPAFVCNIKLLKKIPVKHQVSFHMDDDTISVTPFHEESNEEKEDQSSSESESLFFEIKEVISHQKKDDITYYKVWWKGYKKASTQWCKESDINAPDVIADYHAKIKAQNNKQ